MFFLQLRQLIWKNYIVRKRSKVKMYKVKKFQTYLLDFSLLDTGSCGVDLAINSLYYFGIGSNKWVKKLSKGM